MRRLLTARWLLCHIVAVALVLAFLRLGWWQLTRAEGGNGLSIGYTLEWPAFAAFVIIVWLREVRSTLRTAAPSRVSPASGRDGGHGDASPPSSAGLGQHDPEAGPTSSEPSTTEPSTTVPSNTVPSNTVSAGSADAGPANRVLAEARAARAALTRRALDANTRRSGSKQGSVQ